jgi:NTP pyrophosphatase (non-canonical NTP hydrolase)
MDFKKFSSRAEHIRNLYHTHNEKNGLKQWTAAEYAQGLAGDFGDLSKLILAKHGFREIADVEAKLEHELADMLWSILVIARELDVDLEASFLRTMNELESRMNI